MYLRFTRFLLPLVLTILIFEFGAQGINAGMARMPDAVRVLAAFGLAWGLVTSLSSPLAQLRYAGMVLVEDKRDFWRGLIYVSALALIMVAVQWLLSGTLISRLLLEELHAIDAETSERVRIMMLWLLPMPLLRGITQLGNGILTRGKQTGKISAATAMSVAAGLAAVVALLQVDAIRTRPIWLPILVLYASTLTESVTIIYYLWRFWGGGLPDKLDRPPITYAALFHFTWPVALMNFMQESSRPLINLFVVRGAHGAEAMAALTVAYTLGQWTYRWLNEIRALVPPFYAEVRSYRPFLLYTYWCGAAAFAICLLLFWTPLRTVLLEQVIGVTPALAELSRVPLQIYTFFPFVVVHRAYFHSIAFMERDTRPMAVGAPMRTGAILVALLALPLAGLQGAALGVAALLAGFTSETLTLWWLILGRKQLRVWRTRLAV
ncbi:MAG: hypothetical protein F4047_00265 [Caldilineaceae bacterium SB0670_bin_27]|uniref:MATE family efflux transporter n=1 Tax=Caldilineaceae bacterium SB0664_bin_27 TaxID=2605260 RepID=A0A6B0YX15_9CHLR|nr:hypothetical protein [Caldilineaceae bacterium SB0664_bin_27]MYJ76619.1 hypothetical protein [Caldilineaceae bacterium SB0670_bin_27]